MHSTKMLSAFVSAGPERIQNAKSCLQYGKVQSTSTHNKYKTNHYKRNACELKMYPKTWPLLPLHLVILFANIPFRYQHFCSGFLQKELPITCRIWKESLSNYNSRFHLLPIPRNLKGNILCISNFWAAKCFAVFNCCLATYCSLSGSTQKSDLRKIFMS